MSFTPHPNHIYAEKGIMVKSYLSPSSFNAWRVSARALIAYWNKSFFGIEKEVSDEMTLGSVFDQYFLTNQMPKDFAWFEKPSPDQTMAAKANKEAFSELQARFRMILPIEKKPILERMIKSARAVYTPAAGVAQKELSGTLHGIDFIGFADFVTSDEVIEVKTMHNISPRSFINSVFDRGIDFQCLIYNKLTGLPVRVLAVENKAPYHSAIIDMSDFIKREEPKFEELCEKYMIWQSEMMPITSGYHNQNYSLW